MRALHALRLLLLLAFASAAAAHDRTTSFSSWRIDREQAQVALTMHDADVAGLRLGSGDDALASYAASRLTLIAGGAPCHVQSPPQRVASAPGRVRLEWRLAVPANAPLAIHTELFTETNPGHLHFASLQRTHGTSERVLTHAENSWPLELARDDAQARTEPARFPGYLHLGIEHIVTGYDHLVFLFALLLAGGSFGTLVRVVTGFTVGHSITLGLASLQIVRPEPEPIEALIGLSIALVAVENVWLLARGRRLLPVAIILILLVLGAGAVAGLGRIPAACWLGLAIFLACYYPLLARGANAASARWAVALIFGLVHGFGFASVLLEAELPRERLVSALVGFNLGVEAGQIILVALAWPLLHLALRRWRTVTIELGSTFALGLGVYWVVERSFT